MKLRDKNYRCADKKFSEFVSRELESVFYPFVCPPSRTSRVIIHMEGRRADFYDLFTRDIASQFTRVFRSTAYRYKRRQLPFAASLVHP